MICGLVDVVVGFFFWMMDSALCRSRALDFTVLVFGVSVTLFRLSIPFDDH